MSEAVIVAYGRSPIGRAFKGSLIEVRPDDLAATVVRSVLDKVPAITPRDIEDLICGCGLPGGEHAFNMGRAVSLLSHIDVPGTTITRYCASSLQAARMAAHAIWANEGEVFVVSGVECVTRYANGVSDIEAAKNPRLLPGNTEGFPDLYISMGMTAENVAKQQSITREEMDAYALKSQQRTAAACAKGFFAKEILPITLPNGTVVDTDDSPRPSTTAEGLANLQPVFVTDGTVTAGNSCPLNDGASALVIMSKEKAQELGIAPLAKIRSTAITALEPEYMGLGPIAASATALRRAGIAIADIDLVELNEAFAAQVIPAARGVGVDPFDDDRFNVHGGAISLGHPFGMTGARLIGTLANALTDRDKHLGLATLCVGGGMGMAMVIERM